MPTITLQATKDIAVNYMDEPFAPVAWLPPTSHYPNHVYLVHFDLSSIPSGAVIEQANLTVVMRNPAGNFDLSIHRSTQLWYEQVYNTSNFPGGYNSSPISSYIGYVNGAWAMNVTTSVREIVENGVVNYGWAIRNHTHNTNVAVNTKDQTDSSLRPVLQVTYRTPPTAPRVTTPSGGETWEKEPQTIRWTAATSENVAQNHLRYQVQLSTNNGSTWKNLISLTSAGATSYTHNFASEQASSTARIRVRAYDGYAYGAYHQSNVFTIQDNLPPNVPTNLSPSGVTRDRFSVIRFSWTHTDPNSNDPQSKFDLRWRQRGTSTWINVTQNTTYNYWDAPSGTFPNGEIEWQVRTYDQAGLVSPYSTSRVFTVGVKAQTPQILEPANDEILIQSNPVVTWSSVGQVEYQVRVMDVVDDVIHWETTRVSTNKAQSVDRELINNKTYRIMLRVVDAGGLWSDWASVLVIVSYTPPIPPKLTLQNDNSLGKVTISIENFETRNLLPPFNEWDLHTRATVIEPYKLELDATGSGEYSSCKVSIGVNENSQYTFSSLDGLYQVFFIDQNENDISGIYSPTTFTTPEGTRKIRVETYNDSAGQYTYTNPQLEHGDKATDFTNMYAPPTAFNDIYRRKLNENWIRIIKDVDVDGTIEDYAIASNQIYEYFVRSWSANGAYVDSEIIAGSVKLTHALLNLTSDYSISVPIKFDLNPSADRTYKHSTNRTLTHFAGRKYPVAEFSENNNFEISASFVVTNFEDLESIISLFKTKDIMLYRDSRGIKSYVTIDELDIKEAMYGWWNVGVKFDQVSFSEEV